MTAAAGNATALCAMLISGPCSTYSGATGLFTTNPPAAGLCEGFYGAFPQGLDSDTSGNTIGCRQHYAAKAVDAATAYYCQYASLVGGGVCGVPLNNTCTAVQSICGGDSSYPFTGYDDCYTQLSYLNTTFGSLQGPSSASEDSLECRVYHVTASKVIPDHTHCGHTAPHSAPCNAAVTTNVSHYCGLSELTCSDSTHQQYFGGDAATQWASCTGIANVWSATAPFTHGASTPDLAGHQYHVFANANAGGNSVHCAHAGPSGGGVVGTTYAAWGQAAQTAFCKNGNMTSYVYQQVGDALLNWPVQLMGIVPPDAAPGSYNVPAVSAAGANTETCRIYHLSAAATSAGAAATHCPHGGIFGAGPAGPVCGNNPVDLACKMIAAACPSNYKDSATCQAALTPYFNATMMGDPNINPMNPPKDDTLVCRLFYTSLALGEVGMNKTASSTNCMNAMVDPSPGCGRPAKSGVAPLAASAVVSSMMMLLW